MARKKKKQKSKGKPAAVSTGRRRGLKRWEIVVIGVFVLLAAWGGWSWWRGQALEKSFAGLVAEGQAGLFQVETPPETSSGHLSPGQSAGYRDRFPTSGAHATQWVRPGLYDAEQPSTQLVHSLEHGLVVVYYDKPPAEIMAALESWAGHFGGPWSGVVLAPARGIGEEIVLTAWRKRLRLDPFDAAAAAAFIDRYRGRGPENRVR